MPFLTYSRDKRGYEYVSLAEQIGRRGKLRTRILYWYRTPPNVKVGRDPFDEESRRAIEARHPDLEFDWEKLLATPKPPPVSAEAEHWRERRRQTKASRSSPGELDGDEESSEQSAAPQDEPGVAAPVESSIEIPQAAPEPEGANETAPQSPDGEGRRRRRRRRRGRRPGENTGAMPRDAAAASEPDLDMDTDAGELRGERSVDASRAEHGPEGAERGAEPAERVDEAPGHAADAVKNT